MLSAEQFIAYFSDLGAVGVFIAMFLESSIIPIPSELVVIAAGYAGFSVMTITIFGTLGSTIGAAVGYTIGKYAARPILHRYGKWILMTPERLSIAENFAKKHGTNGVLIGRLLPFIPFKVFSIASGIVHLNFPGFLAATFIGSIPRMYILATFGEAARRYTIPAVIILVIAIVIYFKFRKEKVKLV